MLSFSLTVLVVLYSSFFLGWCETIKCLCGETKWGGWCRRGMEHQATIDLLAYCQLICFKPWLASGNWALDKRRLLYFRSAHCDMKQVLVWSGSFTFKNQKMNLIKECSSRMDISANWMWRNRIYSEFFGIQKENHSVSSEFSNSVPVSLLRDHRNQGKGVTGWGSAPSFIWFIYLSSFYQCSKRGKMMTCENKILISSNQKWYWL